VAPSRRFVLLVCIAVAMAAVTRSTTHSKREDPSAVQRGPRFEEVRRFRAPEARQGVAVDRDHFYAIGNVQITKYAKQSGKHVAEWKGEAGGPFIHLNSCIVHAADLICAHSNYPAVPMVSSIETLDATTLRHKGSHSFGVYEGSLTWAIRRDGDWWLNFAHYGNAAGTPGKGPEYTTLVRFGEGWTRKTSYTYPAPLMNKFAPYSSSGGNWGSDGHLYVTGHDQPELYVLRLPATGFVLEWVQTVAAPIRGQAWAFDPDDPKTLWGIDRASGEVVVATLRD
jgi:hypothetical protein